MNVLVHEVEAILMHRQRKLLIYLKGGGFLIAMLISAVPWLLLLLPNFPRSLSLIIFPIPLIPLLGLGIYANVAVSSRNGVVIPMYEREFPKAWYVSNELKVALAASIIGAIVGAIAALLVVGVSP